MGENEVLTNGTLFAVGEDGSYHKMLPFDNVKLENTVTPIYGTLEQIHFDEIFRIMNEPISVTVKIEKYGCAYLKYLCGLQTNNWKKSHGYPMRRRKAIKHRW